MIQRMAKVGRLGVVTDQAEKLPYSIELWDSGGQSLERVLGTRSMHSLRGRSFTRRRRSIPSRILLRRGARTVADSAD